MLNGKEHRCLKGVGVLRVYTFTLPKFVSGIVRKCMVVFSKDDSSKVSKSSKKATATASASATKKKKKKQEKTPG